MIQMAVGQQHVVDSQHLIDREVTDSRPGIDENVLVHQEGRGSAVAGDGARAAEHADFHGVSVRVASALHELHLRTGQIQYVTAVQWNRIGADGLPIEGRGLFSINVG